MTKQFLRIGLTIINPDMVIAVAMDGDSVIIHMTSPGDLCITLHQRLTFHGEEGRKVWKYFVDRAPGNILPDPDDSPEITSAVVG